MLNDANNRQPTRPPEFWAKAEGLDGVRDFLRWLIRLDDARDPQGVEDRRTVTLNQIITYARSLEPRLDRAVAGTQVRNDTITHALPEMTLLEVPVAATYTDQHGETEPVRIVGSDLSRSTYPVNMLLIERRDGSRCLTVEGRVGSPAADSGALSQQRGGLR